MSIVRTRLERRRRAAARVALYGALLLIVGALAASAPLLRQWYQLRLRQSWAYVDWRANEAVDLLSRYIQVDTNCATGNEIPGAEFLASQLRAAGVEPHIEILDQRHANVWAVLEGRDPKALVLHNHIDTDPLVADGGWDFSPLSGRIEPPWIYGRGVFDMKSVAIAQLTSFLEVKRSGRPLARSLVFLATGSEEVGSELGTQWFLRARPELASRFWAVLTEGGAVEATTREDFKYWGIETAQRGYVEVWACANDRARLEQLSAEVRAFSQSRDVWRLTPEVEEIWRFYAATRTRDDLRSALRDPRRLLVNGPELAALPNYLRSALHDEVVPFPIEPAANGGWELKLMVQLLPGTGRDEGLAEMLPPWLTWGFDTRMRGPHTAPRGSSLDHPLFALLQRIIRDRYPDTVVGPYFLPTTATDARYFRPAGVPAYGFSPFLLLPSDTLKVGQPNERMALPAFTAGVELYHQVVQSAVL